MLNLFRFIGLGHLRQKPFRAVLTTLGIAFGVALYVAIEIINRSTLSSFKESVEAVAGKAVLAVTAGEAGFPEDKLEIIRKVPGVKHAVPMVMTRAYFAGDTTGTQTIVVLGVDMLKEQAVRSYRTTDQEIIDDPLVFLNQPDSVIITHQFAQAHGFKSDSKFAVAAAHGQVELTVRGMLTPEGPAKAYGGAVALMDIDGARVSFGKEGKLDRVDIVGRDGVEVEQIARNVREALGPGYNVDRPETQSENMERMVKSFQVTLTFFSTLALLVAIFLVGNSVSVAVAERRKEIGILRAVGATRKGILFLFLGESFLMGLVGSAAGAWLGRGMAAMLVHRITAAMSTQFMTKIEVSKLHFTPREFAIALALGTTAALVAALWPAFQATRVHPLEAMRPKDISTTGKATGLLRVSPIIGFAFMVLGSIISFSGLETKSGAIRTFNQLGSMLGAALLGPVVVVFLVRMLNPVFASLGTVPRLSKDNLLRNPKRTASNVMSLMVGLILVIVIAVTHASFQTSILNWLNRTLVSDILISSAGSLIAYSSQPIHESLADEINAVPGIRKENGRGVVGLRFVHVQYEGKTLGLKAFDEPHASLNYASFDIQDRAREEAGRELFHSPDPTAFISTNFQLHFGLKTGDHLKLSTPRGIVDFRIVGVLVDFASPEGVIYIKRDLYKQLWGDSLVSVYGAGVEKGYDPNAVRQEIDRRMGQSKNLMTVLNNEVKSNMIRTLENNFSYLKAIEATALLVALLGLLNTLLISIMERTRELGMLRAVGMTKKQMFRMILQEALIQGGFGALVAVAFGTWMSYAWIRNSMSHVLGWIIEFQFPWHSIGSTVLMGLGIALVGGFYPAYRAAQIPIQEALEYE